MGEPPGEPTRECERLKRSGTLNVGERAADWPYQGELTEINWLE